MLRAYLAAGERYRDVAELLLGELFANAVQHAGAPDDRLIEVRFALAGGRLRIEVHDAGAGAALRPLVPGRTKNTAAGCSSSTSSRSAGVAARVPAASASSSGPSSPPPSRPAPKRGKSAGPTSRVCGRGRPGAVRCRGRGSGGGVRVLRGPRVRGGRTGPWRGARPAGR
ncbi:ATP-binding protein [Kitasatospora sp. NPDC089509]|uniref:ATP-binding protein n=1 Tax=Kitasatospora sp. NPDC089509 TaxID=3364079 RepID=UPI003809F9CB